MSKKSRRSRSKYRATQAKAVKEGRLEQPEPVTQDPAKLAINKTSTSGALSRGQKHTVVDYSYVIKDVRFIGILGGSLIAILIILSFILG